MALSIMAESGSLETAARMRHWRGLPQSCPLCRAQTEDVEHVVPHCTALGDVPTDWVGASLAAVLELERPAVGLPSSLQVVKDRLVRWWQTRQKSLGTPTPLSSPQRRLATRVVSVGPYAVSGNIEHLPFPISPPFFPHC